MQVKDFVPSLVPNVPDYLYGKLTYIANYALHEKEVRILALGVFAIVEQLKKENIKKESLTKVNAVFTRDGSFALEETENGVFGRHVSFAIYAIENLRRTNNERFMLFAFVEELVHHYWRMEDETKVKYKVLEIVQMVDQGITLEMVKGWDVNGL